MSSEIDELLFTMDRLVPLLIQLRWRAIPDRAGRGSEVDEKILSTFRRDYDEVVPHINCLTNQARRETGDERGRLKRVHPQ